MGPGRSARAVAALPGPRRLAPLVGLALGLLALADAQGGHESPFYPSFYPQEITLERVAPAAAAGRLEKGSLHAYVGGDPFAGAKPPAQVAAVESLGAYLVATLNPRSPAFADAARRCEVAGRIARALTAAPRGWVVHPYPVTPYHPDYLAHHDLAEAARAAPAGGDRGLEGLRLDARGPVARALVGGEAPAGAVPDATVEEIEVRDLLRDHAFALDGWMGPPWLKEGWFHAYLLLAGTVGDPERRRALAAQHDRLVAGGPAGAAERIDLERALVTGLRSGCERVVLGYTLRREYANTDYSGGVENVGADAQAGLASPIFVRTVKLKDFPWNGWLTVGVGATAAAWNPVAGFTDPGGRLVWAAVGDPAALPTPRGAGWIPNRVTAAVAPATGRIEVPADALLPDAGSGRLRPVPPGRTAAAKVVARARLSAFHDGSRMTAADVLAPFVFAARWGGPGAPDPAVARAAGLVASWLAGLRLVKVDREVKSFGEELKFAYDVAVVEVYLTRPVADPDLAAALAPPWSTLPWTVLVLLDEAAARGWAAFSESEARRRGVPWLDLVRDPALGARLAALVDGFRAAGYRPEGLQDFVTPEEARARWDALRKFYDRSHHFLVTNGPYRLDRWSGDGAVLGVFRDLSYPLGVGHFDRYAIPLRAYPTALRMRGDRLEVEAEVERVSRFQRTYEVVREPLRGGADESEVPECRYLVLASDGRVVRAGRAAYDGAGRFTADLSGLARGTYTVAVQLVLAGNTVNAEVRSLRHRAGGRS